MDARAMAGAGAERLISNLAAGVLAGDARMLARAITYVENDTEIGAGVRRLVRSAARSAPIIGFTGAPGAGKSHLISAYVAELRQGGARVAVLAVDPSSAGAGGAILGDRIRMVEHLGDSGVLIRSLAARGRLGGLSGAIDGVAELVAGAGFDVILIESVGAGQSEVDIRALADVVVIVVAPGQGDDIQAMKSGLNEVADIFVVNKADLPGAARAANDLSAMLAMRPQGAGCARVLKASALKREGLGAVCAAAQEIIAARGLSGEARWRRAAEQRLAAEMARRARETLASDPRAEQMLARFVAGELPLGDAITELARLMAR